MKSNSEEDFDLPSFELRLFADAELEDSIGQLGGDVFAICVAGQGHSTCEAAKAALAHVEGLAIPHFFFTARAGNGQDSIVNGEVEIFVGNSRQISFEGIGLFRLYEIEYLKSAGFNNP